MVAPTDRSISQSSTNSFDLTGEGVIIDIGTGDGRFVYQSARRNPKKFYIGIDPNVRPLEKISEKIFRKPAKGGASNVLFIQAAVEDLPAELNGVADELHIHFPWGHLLRAVAGGEVNALRNLRRICSRGALLEVVIGLDSTRDRSELERLEITELSLPQIDEVLTPKYAEAGFEITERGILPASEWPEFNTSWAKRLQQKRKPPDHLSHRPRHLVYFRRQSTRFRHGQSVECAFKSREELDYGEECRGKSYRSAKRERGNLQRQQTNQRHCRTLATTTGQRLRALRKLQALSLANVWTTVSRSAPAV